jgi:SAM-dependent methyltransferase
MRVESAKVPGTITEADRRASFAKMLDEDGHDNLDGYLHEAAHLFSGVPIANRTILEIGSGRGLMTLYVAMQGAANVVSMEPELIGSRSGMISLQQERLDRLGLQAVQFLAADFNEWDPQGRTFDVVMCRAAINHMHASDQHALHHSSTYRGYLEVVRKMHRVTAPGGAVLITDACRYAFFTATRNLGIRRPWDLSKTGINWRHHQNPQTWARIFRDGGFSDVAVRYPLPYRLRQFGGLVDTAAANFLLQGSFILRATR